MIDLPPEPRIRTRVKVFYFDTDAAGVVHNVAYLRLVEVGRSELAEKLGWSLAEMGKSGIVPVLARTEIDYRKPARLGEALLIESSLTRLERVRFVIETSIRKEDEYETLVYCRQTLVTIRISDGRPQAVPESWVRAYPHLRAVRNDSKTKSDS
ncbi:4-hydroxybenzoyl-CoA thioesterase [Methylacidimicrobium cyclopophantes]|uniref:4-hydroxybenzoyl-CoA thioesterase n=1 Tax=Methylacidimicrobium cyclopophantes TaxID=1041766 RepID=A0A5E6MB53_9BACT|nr:thioesterase family protein [Methylacidimicrobium cyclopophantes]VVM06792.1 4-hydroxybenzoyl-CoA thioesterase [Methylacidimicrobium cyclopophantes]